MNKNKGTIIYIGGFELPDKNAAAHRVLANGKILKELGFKVVFLGIKKNKDLILDTSKFIDNDFEYWSLPYPKSLKQWISYMTDVGVIFKIIKQYQNVKFIITYNYQAVALKKLIKYTKLNKIKIIADCTEWYGSIKGNVILTILKKIDTFYRMRILHKKMDGIIVISNYLEKYYKRNVTLNVPPLVDLNEKKWNESCSKNNRFTLVYAGSPGKKDRLDYLLKAVNNINLQYHLKIIGITSSEYLKLYPKDKRIKNKNIEFYGRLDHNDAVKCVKSANYTCFFRKQNRTTNAGFPTKFVESISCGTPVITNNSSNIEEYFKSSFCGICIDSLEIAQIQFAIEKCIYNDELNNNKVNSLLFDYHNYIEEFENFLKRI